MVGIPARRNDTRQSTHRNVARRDARGRRITRTNRRTEDSETARRHGQTIRIVLADLQPIVLHGLRRVLEAQPDLRVVAECRDGMEATRIAAALEPDILVVGSRLGGLDGEAVARELTTWRPGIKVLIFSADPDLRRVVEALRSGAAGYVSKECPPTDLLEAIGDVASGKVYVSPALGGPDVESYLRQARQSPIEPLDTPGAPGLATGSGRSLQHSDCEEALYQCPYGRAPPRECNAQARSQRQGGPGPICCFPETDAR